jgi:hypothetical protein
MMRFSAAEVEAAFVETAREQVNGEPFNWQRVADHLNERLGARRERGLMFVRAGEQRA